MKNLTKKELTILADLLELLKNNLLLSTLIDDIKEDSESYTYSIEDLKLFMLNYQLTF